MVEEDRGFPMEIGSQKKVSDRCKHGLGLGTCWLCKGGKPTPEWARRDLLSTGGLIRYNAIGKVDLELMNLEDAAQESAGSLQ